MTIRLTLASYCKFALHVLTRILSNDSRQLNMENCSQQENITAAEKHKGKAASILVEWHDPPMSQKADSAATKQRQQLDNAKLQVGIEIDRIKLEQAKLELERAQRQEAKERSSDDESRTLVFVGVVDQDSALEAGERLRVMSRRFPGQPITVIFNSPGGQVIHGLALYDQIMEMRKRGHHVTTIARGQVASMGGILLQAGTERIIGKHAHMLIHEVSFGAQGKMAEMEDRIGFSKKLQERLVDILAERSTLAKAEIRERWHKTDWWLGSRQAVKLGFADRVG
jgi:ATP-dependent Clp protease protease subunit